MERADKAIREKDELTFLLKEQKAINADQLEELKRANDIICKLQEKNNKLKRRSRDTQLKNIAASAVGLFAGLLQEHVPCQRLPWAVLGPRRRD